MVVSIGIIVGINISTEHSALLYSKHDGLHIAPRDAKQFECIEDGVVRVLLAAKHSVYHYGDICVSRDRQIANQER
jgi:hypothetical protein